MARLKPRPFKAGLLIAALESLRHPKSTDHPRPAVVLHELSDKSVRPTREVFIHTVISILTGYLFFHVWYAASS
jgi:hypothetical protein